MKKEIAFFDLETTGVNVVLDRIVEIAITITDENLNVKESYKTLVNPGIEIPKEASEVHGITNDDVKDAPTFKDISEKVISMFEGRTIGGFRIEAFDLPLLIEEMFRVDIEFDFTAHPILDVYKNEMKLNPRTLSALFNKYTGTTLEGAHAAEVDNLATIEVLKGQMLEFSQEISTIPDFLSEGEGMYLDAGKKLKLIDGEPCWTFGMHKDVPLRNTPESYLLWVISSNFGKGTKFLVQQEYNKRKGK